jgi:predicted nucleotidyltransferase component of viral defense system
VNLFEHTIENVLKENAAYAQLRPVIEKEVLHYDILQIMNKAGYFRNLTFIGGTCLRTCYGSERLSEDLDFTGGFDFNRQTLSDMRPLLQEGLQKKYGFIVSVTEPENEKGNTDTWKIKIITRPEQPNFPMQRINIDICMLPSRDRKPAMIKNHYGIDNGTSGIILYAESLEEILADKIIAFALRPNRVKNRDLWDIFWLHSRSILLQPDLLRIKISDRSIASKDFLAKYTTRLLEIKDTQKEFLQEMRRFLKPSAFTGDITSVLWWEYLLSVLQGYRF